MSISFRHSGDIGDLIYAMPVISALCERDGCRGTLAISASTLTRVKAGQGTVDLLKRLIESQCPIDEVRLHYGEPVRYDLDRWRGSPNYGTRVLATLAQMHAEAFGLSAELFEKPWIKLPEKGSMGVVIARSPRYQNPAFPWKEILKKWPLASFVGLQSEYDAMTQIYPAEMASVEYHPTKDFLELAEFIRGRSLFIGNQSSPFAVAEALKKPVIQETCLGMHGQGAANCVFRRRWAQHVVDGEVELWNLDDLPDIDV